MKAKLKYLVLFFISILTVLFIFFIKTKTNLLILHELNLNAANTSNIITLSPFELKESKKLRNVKSKYDKWIVVTSINDPTEQIDTLSKIKGYQLLVVGDLKTDQNWSHGNVIYLNISKQKILDYKSYQTTLFNSYTRKNIGYLFAIEMGARFIYDTDDDNSPLVNLLEYFNYDPYNYGLIYDPSTKISDQINEYENLNASDFFLNPYAHFGQPTIWPRGYPLSYINLNYENNYLAGKRKTSFIQQGVVNGDPDVDAIFRLTKSMNNNRINIYFDSSAPSLQIPSPLLVPFNSQNTLFHFEAFWALYLPKTVTFRLTDIWRSYWSQRLLCLINGTVQFNGPSAFQKRNAHSYLKDFSQETDMYLKTERFVKFLLLKWKCLSLRFYECLLDLSIKMAYENFWHFDEVESIENWLKDLNSIGYKEPVIINYEHQASDNRYFNLNSIISLFKFSMDSILNKKSSDGDNITAYTLVRYTPKFQSMIDVDNSYCCNGRMENIYSNYDSLKYLIEFCKTSNSSLKYNISNIELNQNKSKHSSDIILLVTFNFEPLPTNIEFIKHFYGSHFNNIIFCGYKIRNVLNGSRGKFKRFDSYTFIELDTHEGFFHYYCMTKAIEMGYIAKGIFLMSDDVLVKYWELDNLNMNKIWLPENMSKFCNFELTQNFSTEWHWWSKPNGLKALLNLWDHVNQIKNQKKSIGDEYVAMFNQFYDFLFRNNSKVAKVCRCPSDVFYLPKSKFKMYHFLSSLFRKFKVFLELALPTILAAIQPDFDFEIVSYNFTWYGNQIDLYYLDSMGVLTHPVKISRYFKSEYGDLFCEKVVQKKIDLLV